MRPPARVYVQPEGPRYLRHSGNRNVRRRRRARTAARVTFWCVLWLAGATLAAAGFREGWRLLMDPAQFPLERVLVEGGSAGAERDVLAALAPLRGRNVLTIDLREVERRAASIPSIQQARVRRRLPSTLLVIVEERGVEALLLAGAGVRIIGGDGVDMGAYEAGRSGENHPVITGALGSTTAETAGRVARGLAALRRLRDEAPEFVESLSAIDVARADRLTATLRDYRPPVYLSPEDPARNIDRIDAIRRRLASGGVEAEYIDLRFRDRVAVMPVRDGENVRGA